MPAPLLSATAPTPTADHRPDPEPTTPPATLHVLAWDDPVVDAHGHDPRSDYVERFWLPILGPSTTWLLRRLADELEAHPEGAEVDLAELAGSLGLALRRSGAKPSPMLRAIERSCTFGATRQLGEDRLAARRRLAPLSRRQIQRLPAGLRAEHERWDRAAPPAAPSADELRQRARTLALSLLQLGESERDTERQLHRWHVHPAMAHDALRWARERHAADTGT